MKKSTFKLTIVISLFALSFGCKKDVVEQQKAIAAEAAKLKTNTVTGSPTPPLDWENIAFMPGPPNATPIPVPWQSGLGGSKIDDDIISDYQKVNGWELVYNTFNTTSRLDPLYFMLYNKYRGLLRVYFYISPGSNYPSSNIVHLLKLTGASAPSSPLLNFAGQDMIDVNTKSQSVSQIQQYKVSTTGSWYAAEFELAYDKNAPTTSFDQSRLEWQINPNSVVAITLNGTQTGNIDGTITSTSGTSNFFGSVVNNILDGGLKLGADTLKTKSTLSFLPSFVKAGIVDATKSALGGIVKGFFSAILGGGSASTNQKVNLKINTKINISGNAVIESQLYDNVFSLPGTLNINNNLPYYPAYTAPMGVFYISAKPVVDRTVISTLINDGVHAPTYLNDHRFSVDESSFQVNINPAVEAVATVSNIRKEIILLSLPPSGLGRYEGTKELVGDKTVYSATAFEYYAPRIRTYDPGVAVRISMDVIPKDGSPKCTIVKTFSATQVSQ
ncbi:hypothetical protein [Mucilaginibacter sp. 44-25]|uniref:hypothetical protein n=1 Tax=Mucilaginibacter sp. 44-25 TaxID=1895794 RepID=UPI00096419E0|nr:hypothetical protein [Mucilaginibacter sp. 44-25]OJW16424.1 MAG: hypothetical protein BGO48_09610 [Mucilaginibacter sp. 44-25]